ncbi:S-layer homology domain-containing protein [Paenibacillus swuensis]|uniref:S-layer homology domain-containing protein n=1 Tax=Paenibacillus swuensis TaxID=1178515 RepID=UPI000839549B|nr:S-layer homology domain-containing protein [Paenibacillus swuensis]
MKPSSTFKRFISLALVMILIVSTFAPLAGAATKTTKKHWADAWIQQWNEQDLISSATFQPNAPATRGELVNWINKVFAIPATSGNVAKNVYFTDVPVSSSVYSNVYTAVQAGYISGLGDGTFGAQKSVTRQETAVMLAKLFALSTTTSDKLAYTDGASVAKWSAGAVQSVTEQGFMTGNAGKFSPKKVLTKAEAIVLIDRALKLPSITINKAGTNGPTIGHSYLPKNVIINVPGVTLQNVTIAGNLEIGEGVGQGEAYIRNVNVKGTTTVKGGGENSIHFENAVMVTIVVDKANGTVRLVVEGRTHISDIIIQSPAKVEASNESAINAVTLSEELPKDSHVQLLGSYETVNVKASSIVVDLPKGSVDNMIVDPTAKGTTVNTSKEVEILKLIMNAAIKVTGQALVQNAVVNAAGITMDKAATKMEKGKDVPADVQITVGGQAKGVGTTTTATPTPTAPATSTPDTGSVTPPTTTTPDSGSITPPVTQPEPQPKPEDQTAPIVTGVTGNVYIGDTLTLQSNEDGHIYIVPEGSTFTKIYLDMIVSNTKGVKAENIKDTDITLSTQGLTEGRYAVVAVDAAGNVSQPVRLKIESLTQTTLTFLHIGIGFNDHIGLRFNKIIYSVYSTSETLKAAVSISKDGINFTALAAEDRVSISQDGVSIDFHEEFRGKTYIKLASNSVEDTGGDIYPNEISVNFNSGTNVDLLSADRIDPNGRVDFKVDAAVAVYFVPDNVWGTLTNYENAVVRGDALKRIVLPNEVDQPIFFDTTGLREGYYRLMVWAGESKQIKISIPESPRINLNQVDIIHDTVNRTATFTFNNLLPTDVIKVYEINASTPIYTLSPKAGENFVKIEGLQLYKMHQYTLTQQGKKESMVQEIL